MCGKTVKQTVEGAQNELDKAAKGAKGEVNKLSGGGSGVSIDTGGNLNVDFGQTGNLSYDPSKLVLPEPPSPNLDQDLTKSDLGTVQEAAVQAGTDVQAGVTEIASATGVSNPTLEKLIESNVKGTEASLESNVQGAENTLAEIQQAAENASTDAVTSAVTAVADYYGSGDNADTETDKDRPGGLSEKTAAEKKSRYRLLQASRYGRKKTILTGGSGISGYRG